MEHAVLSECVVLLMNASVVCYRMDCYKCITESLDFLLATNASHPQSTSVPKSPGPTPAKDESRLTTAEADHYVSITCCVQPEVFRSCDVTHGVVGGGGLLSRAEVG